LKTWWRWKQSAHQIQARSLTLSQDKSVSFGASGYIVIALLPNDEHMQLSNYMMQVYAILPYQALSTCVVIKNTDCEAEINLVSQRIFRSCIGGVRTLCWPDFERGSCKLDEAGIEAWRCRWCCVSV
jgi:hypothetical protein